MIKKIDVVFFCVGVYTGAVNRETFRTITIDYPVELAKAVYTHSPIQNLFYLVVPVQTELRKVK